MNFFRRMLRKQMVSNRNQAQTDMSQTGWLKEAFSSDLNQNIQSLRSVFADCADVVFRSFQIGGQTKAFLMYYDGLSDTELMDQHVLVPLMQEGGEASPSIQSLVERKIAVSGTTELQTFADCLDQISIGNPVLLIDGCAKGIALKLPKMAKRGIEEPSAESVIRGPREGFIEVLGVNISLLRRKIPSPMLKLKALKAGRYTRTDLMLAYIEGIADPNLIQEVEKRISRIDIDGILESAYIEELIEDNSFSIFPQAISTERPDVAAANLLEGRVAILINGTPFALIVPVTLYSLLQSSEDYYERFWFSTFTRWLRYGFLVIALLLPSVYVAILTFHQEMIPTSLFLSIAKSREEIPFPALVEAIIMELTFEALREAGVRLPKQVGAAVSIVGALVIGQAAVSAGIVSAPMVMVVAITGIASFMIPRYNAGIAIRLLRFPIMLLAGMLGLLGIILGVIAVVVHLCTLRSFGVPYLTPMGPIKTKEIKDVLMRAPYWRQNQRPRLTGVQNVFRQAPGQKPGPAHEPEDEQS